MRAQRSTHSARRPIWSTKGVARQQKRNPDAILRGGEGIVSVAQMWFGQGIRRLTLRVTDGYQSVSVSGRFMSLNMGMLESLQDSSSCRQT